MPLVMLYRIIHVICCLLHLASCVLAFAVVLRDDWAQTEVFYNAHVIPGNNSRAEAVPTVLGGTNAIVWVAVSEAVSALAHAVGIGVSHVDYPVASAFRRWCFHGLATSILSCALALATGSMDIFLLIFLFAANLTVQFFGLSTDVVIKAAPTTKDRRVGWVFFVLGALFVLPQLVYAPWLATTVTRGDLVLGMPALGAMYVGFYVATMTLQALSFSSRCGDFFDYEILFISLFVAGKLLLAWTLISAIHSRFQALGYCSTFSDFSQVQWPWVSPILLVGAAVDLTIVGFVSRHWKKGFSYKVVEDS